MKRFKVGMIAGNFDVLHPGYVHLFNDCKEYCDELVLFLHEDPSLERPEKLKPILAIEERVLILSSLKQINTIITYTTEDNLVKLIQEVNPDVRFLGDDYVGKKFTGDHLSIPIHFLSRSHGWSTTKFKTLIAQTIK